MKPLSEYGTKEPTRCIPAEHVKVGQCICWNRTDTSEPITEVTPVGPYMVDVTLADGATHRYKRRQFVTVLLPTPPPLQKESKVATTLARRKPTAPARLTPAQVETQARDAFVKLTKWEFLPTEVQDQWRMFIRAQAGMLTPKQLAGWDVDAPGTPPRRNLMSAVRDDFFRRLHESGSP